jgi:hypothetical protein
MISSKNSWSWSCVKQEQFDIFPSGARATLQDCKQWAFNLDTIKFVRSIYKLCSFEAFNWVCLTDNAAYLLVRFKRYLLFFWHANKKIDYNMCRYLGGDAQDYLHANALNMIFTVMVCHIHFRAAYEIHIFLRTLQNLKRKSKLHGSHYTARGQNSRAYLISLLRPQNASLPVHMPT